MHRSPYNNPAPAQSPPLHHPVPQHVSSVPQLRSPPPPVTQQQQQQQQQGGYGGYGQQQQQQHNGNNFGQQAFNGFMGVNDATAQMGFQVGKTALNAGQEYVEQNFNRYVPIPTLKHYFNVTNAYVLKKLSLVLFPWRHRPWSRQTSPSNSTTDSSTHYLPPREDINSPDMYIPLMAFVTYILMYTLIAGMRGAFKPELLGSISGTAVFTVGLEIAGLKLVMYLLSISSESQLFDLVAYSGYKFVGVIVTLGVAEIWNKGMGTGGWVGWLVFAYTFNANAFFLLRSLRYVILPESNPDNNSGASYTANRTQKTRRTYFLFIYSYVIQFGMMWFLSMPERGNMPSRVGAKL